MSDEQTEILKTNIVPLLEEVLKLGKEYRMEGEAIEAHVKLGHVEASFKTVPKPASGRSSYRPRPKPLNLVGAQGVVAEYPDLLKAPVETDGFWFIGTQKSLGDKYQEVNRKLRDVGFTYERWAQGVEHTGGWRGKK